MSNLKEELNAYLNRNEAKSSISIPIPMKMKSLGKFFSVPAEEENQDLLTNNAKYYQNFECCPSLSRFQRIVGFCICVFIGTFFFGVSLLYVPVLALKARKFASMFSFGSVSYLCSFAFLWGPISYIKHIFSVQRLPFTAVYFSSLIATLYFSLYVKSTPITALCAVIQIISLVWYLITYIPGGQSVPLEYIFKIKYHRQIPRYLQTIPSDVENFIGKSSFTNKMITTMIDIDKPRWDQNTYVGRMKYYFVTTNPLNIFKTDYELNKAKHIIDSYRSDGQYSSEISINDLYKAKDIVDSAFHPETKEKMIVLGRMSAQVPINMLINGCMITFYKSTPAVIFWQWFNQSFNALVNYTNRSGSSDIPVEKLVQAYVFATGGALITALSLNKLAKKAPSVCKRLVPFAAVAAANCINIPMMRYRELEEGITVIDDKNEDLGKSRKAATYAISTVVFSRICMCAPGMIFTPFIMTALEKKRFIKRYLWMTAPIQISLTGLFLTLATPMACALFPQTYPIPISKLENGIQERARKLNPAPSIGYYNKGL